MSLYEVQNGHPPCTSFDWTPLSKPTTATEQLSQEQAKEVASRMNKAIKKGKEFIKQAQEKIEQSANTHRRLVDFTVGDKVQLKTKNQKTQCPSRKLDYPMAGPFEILEQVGHSFRLKLPETMQCDDVFSADKLRKATNDLIPSQINKPPPPVEITDNKEQEVEEVLASKLKRS